MRRYYLLSIGLAIFISLLSTACGKPAIHTRVTSSTPTPTPIIACTDIFQAGTEKPFRFQLFDDNGEISCGYATPCAMTVTYIAQELPAADSDKTALLFKPKQSGDTLSLVIPTSFVDRIHLTPEMDYNLAVHIVPNWPNTYGLIITEGNDLVFLGISDWRFDASIVLDCLSPIHIEQSAVLPRCEQEEYPCFGSFARSEIQFSLGEKVKVLRQGETATLADFDINLDYARILDHAFCPDAGTINISYTISKQDPGKPSVSAGTVPTATVITPNTQPVDIPDANLEEYLRRLVHKDTGALPTSELETLRCFIKLNAVGVDPSMDTPLGEISSLQGLEYAFSIEEIWINGSGIYDLSPIADLTQLHSLRIDHNILGSLDPLQNLNALTRLWANNNHIHNLAPLQSLTRLKFLDLGENSIDDLTSLASLTNLTDLSLYHNEISYISPLSPLVHLRRLRLDVNQIQDISAVSKMTELTYLSIDDNQVEDIKPLSTLTSLTSLSLTQNNIRDISAISELSNLVVLYLSDNQIESINALENLVTIRLLDLQDNRITDISPLLKNQGLGEGDRVDFRGNPLNDKSINQLIPELEARGLMISW